VVLLQDLLLIESPNMAQTERVCQAHQHEIVCIAMNQSGSLIASASTKGTLIRIHNSSTRLLLAEFRRGADTANIYCLNFNSDSSFLCVSSDKGTVHIFAIADQSINRKSTLAQVGIGQISKAVGTYVKSQWDCTQFTLPSETPCLCMFSSDDKHILAICMDGTCHRYNLVLEGPCTRNAFDVFLDIGITDL
jgi:WD40 repeat protein